MDLAAFLPAPIALITVAVCLILKKTNPEISMVVGVVAIIIMFAIIIGSLSPIFDVINKYIHDNN